MKAEGADTRIWNRDTIEKTINNDWSIRLQTAFRWRDTTHLYQKFIQLFADYHYSSTLVISPSYRQKVRRVNQASWVNSSQPMLDVTKSLFFDSFHFSNRSRLQYKSDSKELFYRNQTRLSYHFLWDSFEFAPFLTEEIFFLYLYRFDENRLGGGVELTFSSKVQFLFYYFYLNEKNDFWTDSNVTNLEVAFFF